jgi:hypothetical protein
MLQKIVNLRQPIPTCPRTKFSTRYKGKILKNIYQNLVPKTERTKEEKFETNLSENILLIKLFYNRAFRKIGLIYHHIS